MFKDIDIVVCSNEQLANEARTGTKLAWAMPWKEEENQVNSLEGGRRSQVTPKIYQELDIVHSLEEARPLETPPENEGTK